MFASDFERMTNTTAFANSLNGRMFVNADNTILLYSKFSTKANLMNLRDITNNVMIVKLEPMSMLLTLCFPIPLYALFLRLTYFAKTILTSDEAIQQSFDCVAHYTLYATRT